MEKHNRLANKEKPRHLRDRTTNEDRSTRRRIRAYTHARACLHVAVAITFRRAEEGTDWETGEKSTSRVKHEWLHILTLVQD